LYASPKAKSTLDILWAAATSMIEGAERPGDINQALIELGSTVCKVREPLCEQCPLKPWCNAYSLSTREVGVETWCREMYIQCAYACPGQRQYFGRS
jgi:A/G-specific adenine glycosylase